MDYNEFLECASDARKRRDLRNVTTNDLAWFLSHMDTAYKEQALDARDYMSLVNIVTESDIVLPEKNLNDFKNHLNGFIESDALDFTAGLSFATDLYSDDIDGLATLIERHYPNNGDGFYQNVEETIRYFLDEMDEEPRATAKRRLQQLGFKLYEDGKFDVEDLSEFGNSMFFDGDAHKKEKEQFTNRLFEAVLKKTQKLFETNEPDPKETEKPEMPFSPLEAGRNRAKARELHAWIREQNLKRPSYRRAQALNALVRTLSGYKYDSDIASDKAATVYTLATLAFRNGDIDLSLFSSHVDTCLHSMNDLNETICMRSYLDILKQASSTSERSNEARLQQLHRIQKRKITPALTDDACDAILDDIYARYAASEHNNYLGDFFQPAMRDVGDEKRQNWAKKFSAATRVKLDTGHMRPDDYTNRACQIGQHMAPDDRVAFIGHAIQNTLDNMGQVNESYIADTMQSLAKSITYLPRRAERTVEDNFDALLDRYAEDGTISLPDYIDTQSKTFATLEKDTKFDRHMALLSRVEELAPAALAREAGKPDENDYGRPIKKLTSIDVEKMRMRIAYNAHKAANDVSEREHTKREFMSIAATLGVDMDKKCNGMLHDLFRKKTTPEEFRTNSSFVWTGWNTRNTPAIAYFMDEGGTVIDIFNMRGSVEDVRAQVEEKYKPGQPRRAIFDNFISRLGLVS